MIDEVLKFNEHFVAEKRYEPYVTSKFPDKKIAIVSCMDTRLTELLMAALGLHNGDVNIIKNAGGLITSPFDSAVRSLLVGVYELGVEEIMIVGHTDCGAQHLSGDEMIRLMQERGISAETINTVNKCGNNIQLWLNGFDNNVKAVCQSVDLVRNHPLMPANISVRGFIIDSVTGKLTEVK